jgi:2-oxoglutarate ferredoxin oxidoreductase subunit gamma
VCAIPATRIAESELGRKIVANIVMLGFLAANSEVISVEVIREAVLSSIPKGTEELNTRALERGFAYEIQQLQEAANA